MDKYGVLICDDETLICELIRNIVDWDALGLQLIGTVHDGFKALERIRSEKPDIVIMDIRIPGISGMDVVEQANVFAPDTCFIIVSGYQNFEYAQKSIRYNVRDYILKPIMEENLTNALKHVIASLNQQYSDARLKQQSCDNALRSMLLNSDYSQANCKYIAQLFDFRPGLFRVIALHENEGDSNVRAPQGREPELMESLIWNKAAEAFSMVVADKCYAIQRFGKDNTIYFILNYCPENSHVIECRWYHLLEVLDTHIQNYFVVVGRAVDSVEHLGLSMGDCENGLKTRIAWGNRKLCLADHSCFAAPPEFFRNHSAWQELQSCINICNVEKSLEVLRSLIRFEGIDTIRCPLIYSQTVDRVNAILLNGVQQFNIDEETRIKLTETLIARQERLQRRLNDLTDAYQWNQTLLSEFSDMLEMCLEEMVNVGGKQVQEVRQYIQSHLGEKLSLNTLANFMHVNPVYFSAWFKQHNGTGFSEYLQTQRIERAKKLLMDHTLSIDTIAEMVGLNSTSYFRKAFKQEVGISPTQFRKYYN